MENERRKISPLHTNEKKNFTFIEKILSARFSHYELKGRKSAIKIVVGMVKRSKYTNLTTEKTQFRIM
jgi:hypothetical protein